MRHSIYCVYSLLIYSYMSRRNCILQSAWCSCVDGLLLVVAHLQFSCYSFRLLIIELQTLSVRTNVLFYTVNNKYNNAFVGTDKMSSCSLY
jgi:hypothetical protein